MTHPKTKHPMKTHRLLVLSLMLAWTLMASAQIKIPGTHLSFTFPTDEWKYLQTTSPDKNINVYLYSYAGHYVIDSVGDTTLPFMRIYVHKHYSGSVYEMAYQRSLYQPFQSLDEYSYDDGSIGYLGVYTNKSDKKDYEFLMTYMKEKNTLIEIRLETTLDNFDEFHEMFQAILNSVQSN